MKRIVNTDACAIDLTRQYTQHKENKPRGLWYSIDNEWIEWCETEMDHWIKGGLIDISIDESNMLILESLEQLKEFFDRFNCTIYKDIKYIDWLTVTKTYSGIEIRNYYDLKWSTALSLFDRNWFLSWSVSSGCIWDLSIIKSCVYCPFEQINK